VSHISTVSSLADAAQVLEDLGYKVALQEASVAVQIGADEHPLAAVLTMDDDKMKITCQVALTGQIAERNRETFAWAALDANTRLSPYAIGLITDADDPQYDDPEACPVVLTNTLRQGELSVQELKAAMDSLLEALLGSREVLRIGLGG